MSYLGKAPAPSVSEITDNTIVNADISSSAAIAQSKLSLAITDTEVDASAAIAQSKLNLSITNSEVNASAAIAQSKLALDAGLTSISGLTTAADKMIYTTASDTYAVADLTSAGRAILDDADAAAQRTTLGLSNFADLTADQTFTAANRGTITADNDGSFDLTITNNFSCTPATGTTAVTLTFTNIASATGQTGNILLDNGTANGGAGATYSAATNTVMNAAELTRLSAAKKFWLSYYCDGTDVYVTASAALN